MSNKLTSEQRAKVIDVLAIEETKIISRHFDSMLSLCISGVTSKLGREYDNWPALIWWARLALLKRYVMGYVTDKSKIVRCMFGHDWCEPHYYDGYWRRCPRCEKMEFSSDGNVWISMEEYKRLEGGEL